MDSEDSTEIASRGRPEKSLAVSSAESKVKMILLRSRNELKVLLEKEGIEWLNIFSVDNVLQRICDPVFIVRYPEYRNVFFL